MAQGSDITKEIEYDKRKRSARKHGTYKFAKQQRLWKNCPDIIRNN